MRFDDVVVELLVDRNQYRRPDEAGRGSSAGYSGLRDRPGLLLSRPIGETAFRVSHRQHGALGRLPHCLGGYPRDCRGDGLLCGTGRYLQSGGAGGLGRGVAGNLVSRGDDSWGRSSVCHPARSLAGSPDRGCPRCPAHSLDSSGAGSVDGNSGGYRASSPVGCRPRSLHGSQPCGSVCG